METAIQTLSERASQDYMHKSVHRRSLNSYLTDIDRQKLEMFLQLIKKMAEREDITEKLKVENQWMG
ncbi:MAG: TnpV protein [Oscillospiraceae bacterium]